MTGTRFDDEAFWRAVVARARSEDSLSVLTLAEAESRLATGGSTPLAPDHVDALVRGATSLSDPTGGPLAWIGPRQQRWSWQLRAAAAAAVVVGGWGIYQLTSYSTQTWSAELAFAVLENPQQEVMERNIALRFLTERAREAVDAMREAAVADPELATHVALQRQRLRAVLAGAPRIERRWPADFNAALELAGSIVTEPTRPEFERRDAIDELTALASQTLFAIRTVPRPEPLLERGRSSALRRLRPLLQD